MPKTTKKATKTNNNKTKIKNNLIEEENKKLRGYLTTLAKKQNKNWPSKVKKGRRVPAMCMHQKSMSFVLSQY